MQRDIRKLFEEDSKLSKGKMPEGHEARFLQKLDEALPETKSNTFFFMKIAAGLVILFGLGFAIYTQIGPVNTDPKVVVSTTNQSQIKSLGDVSPDLKKLETVYLANINMALAKLDYEPENMELIDGYLKRLAELNKEYDRLNKELSETGPNYETIDALINNLKLRLNLLQRLKDQLNELNNNQNNQNETNIV